MLEVIDYTEIAAELLRQPIPEKQQGKAVLIRHDKQSWFVMAPQQFCRLHADIVRRFFELRKTPTVQRHTRVEATNEAWQVHGGCCYTRDIAAEPTRFFGKSDAYGPMRLDEDLRSQLVNEFDQQDFVLEF